MFLAANGNPGRVNVPVRAVGDQARIYTLQNIFG